MPHRASASRRRSCDVRRRQVGGLHPLAHFELHATRDQPVHQERAARNAWREHATLVGELGPVEAQGQGRLDRHTRGLVVAVRADKAALHLVAVGGLGMQEEAAPRVGELLHARALALLELTAFRLQHRLLLINGHAVLAHWLGLLVLALLHAPLRSSDLLRRQHGVLREAQHRAIRLVAQVRLQHVRAPDDTRVEEGVDVGRAPDTQLLVLRDGGHVFILVLFTGGGDAQARAKLDVHHLDAIAVKFRDVTAQGERVAHRCRCVPVDVAHRRPRAQGATRGAGSRAAT
mmetsp:Transcript_74372/g.240550  ORF Transcript_74372/g.240550 Transcript_74372/m.240550 type:complete len:289 (+) Transcript_74372:208-1074(+)